MTRSGVLSGRSQHAAAIGARGRLRGGDAIERFDIAYAQAREVREMEPAKACDVTEGVATRRVAVLRGVRHGADPNTVEDNPDYASKHNIRG
jgi:hypothetical protein